MGLALLTVESTPSTLLTDLSLRVRARDGWGPRVQVQAHNVKPGTRTKKGVTVRLLRVQLCVGLVLFTSCADIDLGSTNSAIHQADEVDDTNNYSPVKVESNDGDVQELYIPPWPYPGVCPSGKPPACAICKIVNGASECVNSCTGDTSCEMYPNGTCIYCNNCCTS